MGPVLAIQQSEHSARRDRKQKLLIQNCPILLFVVGVNVPVCYEIAILAGAWVCKLILVFVHFCIVKVVLVCYNLFLPSLSKILQSLRN